MSGYARRLPPSEEAHRGRGLGRPAEGWLTLTMSILVVLVMARAVDDPAWVNGRQALTDGLATMALLGLSLGVLGPKVGWGRWTTHVVGALFAGLVIPVMAGWAIAPGTSPAEALRVAADGSAQAYLDIWWRGYQYTSREVHYVVVLGAIMWGTAQCFGYAVFGHHKPLNGLVVVGLVLAGNMALTDRDQVGYLAAYLAVALLLLIAMHTFDERASWVRRRMGDPSALASMYLRGGSVFIAVAMLASFLLMERAASAPLARAWDGVDDQLISIGEDIARLFPVGPDVRGGGSVTFGSTARIVPRWFSGEGIAFTADVDKDMPPVRWRAAAYDTFVLGAWAQTGVTSYPVEAGSPLLEGTPEEADPALTMPFAVTIRPDGYKASLLLAPGIPVATDRAANALLVGTDGWFAGIDMTGGRDPYTVTTALLDLVTADTPDGEAPEGITGNELLAAPEVYPPEIAARYTAVPEGAIGTAAAQLLATVLAGLPDRDPYTLAVAMQDYLHDGPYQYTIDGTGPCEVTSAVECFARAQRGYCLHYASTMAVLLRAANPDNRIPTRLVQGFLPGERNGPTETVRAENAHAWVEVYFPGYGWIPFDPTGGGVGRPSRIVPGPAVTPVPSLPPDARPSEEPEPSVPRGGVTPPGGVTGQSSEPVDQVLLLLLVVLVVVALAGLALAAWMRGPRSEVSPDMAWRMLERAASRFGFARQPTQTAYEYANSLGDLVPVARADLRTVADAKVEVQYARAQLGGARLDAVREATRRLRISLLRLALRGPRRRRRRRD